ncbi:MAG: hypothetical protein SH848_12395 [Saprospiraceae bacterium]|nr:hypothetical protein [Saprospiraceae bacterium]MDZ4704725.1 hypothetical protein [Saprospiraceae bacterium]
MTKYKGLIALAGFIMAGLGFLSIILSMIGLKFSFLTWIDAPGSLFGFVVKIVMILAGFVIIYLSVSNNGAEDEA